MKLKLDENLGHATADLFRLGGHDVEMVQGEGLSGRGHHSSLPTEERCLITLDSDFWESTRFQTLGVFRNRCLALAFQTLASRSAACLSNARPRPGAE